MSTPNFNESAVCGKDGAGVLPQDPTSAPSSFEIKSWVTGKVLFSAHVETVRECVIEASKSGASLFRAYLSGANLSGAYLSGANLSGAYLSGANLSGADLSGANLSGAYLFRASLSRANLSGAYLFRANLFRASLSRANLSGANLFRANLSRANLSGAYLSGANLSGAKGIDKFPIQIFGHKHSLSTTQDGKLRIGCHLKTFEEWEVEAEKIGKDNGYSHLDIEIYKLHVAHVAKVARLLWTQKKESEVSA
jgi:hypothetical protein